MKLYVIGLLFSIAVGLSLGDELGLAESLGNLEGDTSERRRAINYNGGSYSNDIGVLPASEQPKEEARSKSYQPMPRPRPVPNRLQANNFNAYPPNRNFQPSKHIPPQKLVVNPPRKNQMTQAASLPMGVPQFRPIPKIVTPKPEYAEILSNPERATFDSPILEPTGFKPLSIDRSGIEAVKNLTLSRGSVPTFQALPTSISRISTGSTVEIDNNGGYEYFEGADEDPIPVPKVDLMGHTVEELAIAANVSVATIRKAILLREQQLYQEKKAELNAIKKREYLRSTTTSTTTTTTTTPRPTTTMRPRMVSKVMNAPKEYYPYGYEKNFDDNFKSKVELPATSFSCGNQKHFPGLYADVDLGCMVFHVCALTDDGLIMKSFLCPESTLFDQTILKCNWWFYVDCPTSKDMYDSNIPISKSYQLMKSLTYFSNYNKITDNDKKDIGLGIDVEALKNQMAESEKSKIESSKA
ncbi:mtg family protein [Megaselia abdita]